MVCGLRVDGHGEEAAITTVLIIERDDEAMRLMAWAMREEGFTVYTSAGADELVTGDQIKPDVIIFNTGMAVDVKRLWVSSLRYVVPNVDISDLCTTGDIASYDTGADGYLEGPYLLKNLVKVIDALRRKRELAAARTAGAIT